MNLGERIVVALYTFCIAMISVVVALMPFNIVKSWYIENLADYIKQNWIVTLAGAALFVLLLPLHFLLF